VSVFVMVISIVAGSASLAWGYSIAGLDAPARWLLVAGAIWLVAMWRRWNWVGSLILLIFVAAAAFGLWISLPASLMMLGAVGGLLGWDMADFARRLRFASSTDNVRSLELHHLGRVLIVAILSLTIAGFISLVKIRIPFELAVILVLVSAIGLTRLVVWLQRRNE